MRVCSYGAPGRSGRRARGVLLAEPNRGTSGDDTPPPAGLRGAAATPRAKRTSPRAAHRYTLAVVDQARSANPEGSRDEHRAGDCLNRLDALRVDDLEVFEAKEVIAANDLFCGAFHGAGVRDAVRNQIVRRPERLVEAGRQRPLPGIQPHV